MKVLAFRKAEERYLYIFPNDLRSKELVTSIMLANGLDDELSITENEAEALVCCVWGSW